MIEVDKLDVSIEGTPILRGVSLSVPKGHMVGLVGRNGAGKTTLMRSIMGLLKPSRGEIVLNDTNATNLQGFWRARHGIGYMPEDRKLIPDLSARENVLIPAWATGFDNYGDRLEWVYGLMPEVAEFAPRLASSLSGGQQKLVAMARALLIGQRVLLLDEPFEGVAPTLCQRLLEVIASLKDEGISILISESDYTYTRTIVDSSYSIERGSVTETAFVPHETR